MKKILSFISSFCLIAASFATVPVVYEHKTVLNHHGGSREGFDKVTVGEWQYEYDLNGNVKSQTRSIICAGNGAAACNGGSILLNPDLHVPMNVINAYLQINDDVVEQINLGIFSGNISQQIQAENSTDIYIVTYNWMPGENGVIEMNSSISTP